MRTPAKALLFSALFAATPAAAIPVYFVNNSGVSGVVDVYVDGQLMFDNIFPGSAMMFPREMTSGAHQVVVTPFYLAPGQQDLLSTTVTCPNRGTQNLTFSTDSSNTNKLAFDARRNRPQRED